MHPPSRRLVELAVALGFAAAAGLFWNYRIIAPAVGADPGVTKAGDLAFYVYPVAHWARETLLAGTLPLWNPHQYAGHPMLATGLPGVFYPLNVVFLLLPTHLAIEASVLVHLFCAGCFMALYARAIGLSRAASLAAGITFMGSGFVASRALWFTPALAACVWLPLGLLASERLCTRRELRWVLLLGIAVALPALTGWFQAAAYSVYAIAFHAALRLAGRAARPEGRAHLPFAVASLALGVALGACLAAIQVVPSWELQGLTDRGADLTVTQSQVYGTQTLAALLSGAVDSSPGYPRLFYVGILPLVLAPLSLLAPGQRGRLPGLWFLAVFSVGVALTVHTPVLAWFQELPGIAWFRAQERVLFVYAFAAAALMGIGFDVLLARAPGWRLPVAAAGASAFVLACALALDASPRSFAYLAIALAGVWACVAIARARVRRWILWGLLGLLCGDLFLATRNEEFRPYHDVSVYDREADLLKFLRDHQERDRTYVRLAYWRTPGLMQKHGTLSGIYSVTDYEPLSLSRFGAFYRLLGDPLLPHNMFVGRLLTEPAEPQFRLLDLLSVRFVVLPQYNPARRAVLADAGWRVAFESESGSWVAYENPHPLPRAYVATRTRQVPGGGEALAVLAGGDLDFRKEVLVEAADTDRTALVSGADRPISAARIVSHEPSQVVIEADAPEPGMLVLTDTFYPGWVARVDGEPREILRANYLFRAVSLEAGRHRVVFRYEPRSFRLGVALTATSLAAVVAVGVTRRARAVRAGSCN